MADSSPFSSTWTSLPVHIVCSVMSYLPLQDRLHAALTCKRWYSAFQQPHLWQRLVFKFSQPEDEKWLACVDLYGAFFRSVTVLVDQFEKVNRNNALSVFQKLIALDKRRLTSLTVAFVGQNPLFYAGSEFVEAIRNLFRKEVETDKNFPGLLYVDLSGFTAAFDDSLLEALSLNHSNLTSLNIQARCLVSKVSPDGVLSLVKHCRKLKELKVIFCGITDEVLDELASADRTPLEHLSVICRREEKYRKELSSEAWGRLAQQCPELRVTLTFDNTCPLYKVSLIMRPEIPVTDLRLETFTHVEDEVRLATSYYSSSLERVVLQTRNSPGLGEALVNLARHCPRLSCLKVYCVLDRSTVTEVLELCPAMRESGNFILKWQPQAEPWVVGQECGD